MPPIKKTDAGGHLPGFTLFTQFALFTKRRPWQLVATARAPAGARPRFRARPRLAEKRRGAI